MVITRKIPSYLVVHNTLVTWRLWPLWASVRMLGRCWSRTGEVHKRSNASCPFVSLEPCTPPLACNYNACFTSYQSLRYMPRRLHMGHSKAFSSRYSLRSHFLSNVRILHPLPLFTSTSSFTFYIRCLEQLQPSTCPLCRKHFQPNKVKKLHVDRVPDEPDGSNRLLDSHSNVLLQRIAMVSGDRAPDADVAEVITEVFQWLENESDALNAVSATSFVNYPSFIPTHARTEPTP